MFKNIKSTFFDLVFETKTIIFHAEDLLFNSSTKNIRKFYVFVILILAIIIFRSNSLMAFYINLFGALFCSIVSYYIYCLSDYFWFLIKKKQVYALIIKYKKNINLLIKRLPLTSDIEEDTNEKQILSTVSFYSESYKVHTYRYAVEIILLLLILLFTYPLFFLLNIAIFCGMFIYTFIYEQESSGQVFNDITLLLNSITELHKEDPEKCKRFILNNKKEEIKDLKMLYQAVIKIK